MHKKKALLKKHCGKGGMASLRAPATLGEVKAGYGANNPRKLTADRSDTLGTVAARPTLGENLGTSTRAKLSEMMKPKEGLLKRTLNKVKKTVSDRVQAQKNFRNRKDNSNYYGSYKDFLPKKSK